MKDNSITSTQLIADSYRIYHDSVFLYIYYRVNSKEDAEDLLQDVFLRLMDYEQMLCLDTVKCFIYTIARNLITDYLRRYYKRQEATTYMYDVLPASTCEEEEKFVANDLLRCEKNCMRLLPPQRRKIYQMSRFEEKSNLDISKTMDLALRTVENHLFISRKEMRAYMRQCI